MRLNYSSSRSDDVRERLRAAAEALFAEHGVGNVSVRSITAAAGANMAAVNYHFGGKDMLVIEVFRDVAQRTSKSRLDALAALDKRARTSGQAPTLNDVIDAFIDPYVSADCPQTGALLAHLVLMHRVAPTDWTREVVRQELDGLAERFIDALGRAAPHLTAEQLHWRYHLMVGSILIALSDDGANSRMQRLSAGLCTPSDRTQLRRELVNFLVAAFGSYGASEETERH